MEIVVQKSENALLRMEGNLKTTELSAAFALKVANNNHKLAVMAQEKMINSTIKNQIKSDKGSITNLANQVEQSKEQMEITLAKLKWLKELEEKKFLSKMSLREEELKLTKERNNAQNLRHQIALAEALMEAYLKYDQVSLLNQRELAVDEALVNIEKTTVANIEGRMTCEAPVIS
jgi:vacuolar-type H+-ATPase subunit I/STV1